MINYGPLVRNLQIMYPEYKFEMLPIITGAMGYVPKCLLNNIRKLSFNDNEAKLLIRKLQVMSVSGTVKITKTFLKFNI